MLMVGIGFILLSIVVSGIVFGSGKYQLLGSMAFAIISWDVGENGISLGDQLGDVASTRSVELTHALGSIAIGIVGVALGAIIFTIGMDGVPLVGLLALLLSAIILTVALYN